MTSYANENLLQFFPLSLALVVLIPLAARGTGSATAARRVALGVAALSLIGLVMKILPGSQVNGEIIALALPAHLGLLAGIGGAGRRSAKGRV